MLQFLDFEIDRHLQLPDTYPLNTEKCVCGLGYFVFVLGTRLSLLAICSRFHEVTNTDIFYM